MAVDDLFRTFRTAVQHWRNDDPAAAAGALERAESRSELHRDLRRALLERAGAGSSSPYAAPGAFEAYRRCPPARDLMHWAAGHLSDELSDDVDHVIDLGCGNGELLARAIAANPAPPPSFVTLVEPEERLLAAAEERLAAACPDATLCVVAGSLQDFAPSAALDACVAHASGPTLALATWSLQNLAPGERAPALAALAARADRLLLAEFDVALPPDADDDARLRFLHDRYAAGVPAHDPARCGEDGRLAIDGFLMPMLLGAVRAVDERPNHEQSLDAWIDEARRAGLRVRTPLRHDGHWWSPAFATVLDGA